MVNITNALLFFVLFFIVFSSYEPLFADNGAVQKFEQANQLYISKDYSGSIDIYNEILAEGYESAGLYYNLGNAYFRIGKLGFAILNYEKALKLSPKDEDIKHNLTLANLRTTDRVETLPEFFLFEWWEAVLNFFTLKEWIILALVIYLILLGSVAFYFFAAQKNGLISGVVSLIILMLVLSLTVVKFNREENELHGVIVSDISAVKIAPEDESTDAFIVHEGLKIKIEDKLNNWLKIRLIDGKTGWVKRSELEVI